LFTSVRQSRNALWNMLQDFRFALRLFRKHPAPVAIAIGGLSLAIGVVAAVFTVVDRTMLRTFGMDDPRTVVSIVEATHDHSIWMYQRFLAVREAATLTQVEAHRLENVRFNPSASADGDSKQRILFTSGGYLPMLGGRAVIGRSLSAADDEPAAAPAVVISHRLWKTAFNGDQNVVGKAVRVNGAIVAIAGVMHPDFTGPLDAFMRPSLWAPFAAMDDILGGPAANSSSGASVNLVGRLKRGADIHAAQAELTAIAARTAPPAAASSARHERAITIYRTSSPIDGPEAAETYAAIAATFAIVGLVLAVACINTANLLLASSATRAAEMSLRLALGAGARRLVRQVLHECLLLGAAAAALGFLCAFWMAPFLAGALELPAEVGSAPDFRVLLFTTVVGLICGIGAGVSPARHGAGGDLVAALKGPAGARPIRARGRRLFIGFQSAVSMFLLVAAALFIRTSSWMSTVDVGIDIDHLVSVYVQPMSRTLDQAVYTPAALARVRALPSVQSAAASEFEPWGWSGHRHTLARGGVKYEISMQRTDADFFNVIGLRVVRGRLFSADDVAREAPVAVIGETVARVAFGTADPIGQPLPVTIGTHPSDGQATIIGVVSDALLASARSEGYGVIYRPIARQLSNAATLVVRTSNPARASHEIEAALKPLDGQAEVTASVVRDRFEGYLSEKRRFAVLAAPLAGLAVLLGVLGLFGVTLFVTGQRLHEVSVRVALGATRADVLRLLSWDSLRPVTVGLATGLGWALAFSTLAHGYLSGISPYDPAAIGSAVATLAIGALAAVVIPARASTNVDPAKMLRE
jgi:predicted permease